jgi:ectoine hydroxylase-related dioxygenase (phytanoyl-CoA dioxygenase family)
MVTLRVHLDQVGAENGPLLVAPGSHNFGRVDESTLESTVRQCGRYSSHASAGDIWAYATLILHASKASRSHGRRRVLQLDYASTDLPGGLKWLDLIETR